jgi:hypothetical protein
MVVQFLMRLLIISLYVATINGFVFGVDGSVAITDENAHQLEIVRQFDSTPSSANSAFLLTEMTIDASGRFLAVLHRDSSGSLPHSSFVQVWNIETGFLVFEQELDVLPTSLFLSNGGKYLIFEKRSVLFLIDLDTDEEIMIAQLAPFRSVIDKSGEKLIFKDLQNQVILYDLDRLEAIWGYQYPEATVAAFNHDSSQFLLSDRSSGEIRLFEINENTIDITRTHMSAPTSFNVVFSRMGEAIIGNNGAEIYVIDVVTGELGIISSVSYLSVRLGYRGNSQVFVLETNLHEVFFDTVSRQVLAILPDQTVEAVVGLNSTETISVSFVESQSANIMRIRSVIRGNELVQINIPGLYSPQSVTFSADDRVMVAANQDGSLVVLKVPQ